MSDDELELESIDIILSNLKADPEYYNHGVSQEEYSRIEDRRDI